MSEIRSFIDTSWPTRAALAQDVGVSTDAVHKWAQTNSIPAKYHFAVIQSAQRRGIEIDAMKLAEMHAFKASARAS